MHTSCLLFFVLLFAVTSPFAALPIVPGTNEAARYELLGHQKFPRAQGDDFLSILDGGRQLQEWQPDRGIGVGAIYKVGTRVICRLPVSPHDWLNVTLTNGSAYRIGIGNGFVELPEGRYQVKKAAQLAITKLISQQAADLRLELVNAPKPLVYIVGTVDDGGTLSGIAQLFYGDARKWREIYQANRQTIKHPDIITRGLSLTLPKLQ